MIIFLVFWKVKNFKFTGKFGQGSGDANYIFTKNIICYD